MFKRQSLTSPNSSRQAYSTMELMIAVSIMGILAALAVINFSESRKAARDSRRKSDVRVYVDAINAYRLAKSTFMVSTPDTPCQANGASESDPTQPYSGGCTGASGRSFGKLNLREAIETVDILGGPSLVKTYANTTIAQGLKDNGYLATIATDPSNSEDDNIPGKKDYVLIRCCGDGTQSFTKGGSLFAVWAQLEKDPLISETDNTDRYCGGKSAYRDPNSPNKPSYYDFAASFDGGTSKVFSVGNGYPGSTQSNAVIDQCEG